MDRDCIGRFSRFRRQVNQMRRTTTIARTEPFGNHHRARLSEHPCVPGALQPLPGFFDRNVFNVGVLQQIVNVPVSFLASPSMPGQTLLQPVQRTAGIHVVARREQERPQSSHLEQHGLGKMQVKLIHARHARCAAGVAGIRASGCRPRTLGEFGDNGTAPTAFWIASG